MRICYAVSRYPTSIREKGISRRVVIEAISISKSIVSNKKAMMIFLI